MTDERRPVVAGVDTHKDTHYAAVISVTGEHLAAAEFPATQAGYQALQWFITYHGVLVQSAADLRPARRQPGLTITDVANALGYGITKIPRIERSHIRDTRFLHEYRDWLTSQQPIRTAA